MKRIFIVVLCVALCVCAIAVPASASTYEERWTNVLDYATVNNQGSNSFGVSNGSLIPFTLPGSTIVQDIDIVFRSNRNITSVKVIRHDGTPFTLQFVFVGSGIYRAYGNLGGYSFDTLSIALTFDSGTVAYGEILQLRISSQTVDFYNVPATINKSLSVSGPSSHSAGGDTTAFYFTDTGEWAVIFTVSDWKKYDYIDFAFRSKNITIGNISAMIGDRSIEVNVESYNGDPEGTYENMTTGYFDIYGVDHDDANDLTIIVIGTCYNTSGAQLWLSWLNGSVKVDDPSIFALIWNSIKDGFNRIYAKLHSFHVDFSKRIYTIMMDIKSFVSGNEETNDKIDGITDYAPEVNAPPGGESVGGLNDSEQALMGDVSSGLSDINSQIFNGVNTISKYAFGLACVSNIVGYMFNVSFIYDLLTISLSLSVIVVLFSVIVMVSNKHSANSKEKSKQVRSRKGG